MRLQVQSHGHRQHAVSIHHQLHLCFRQGWQASQMRWRSVRRMSRYGIGRALGPQMACIRRSQFLLQVRFGSRAKHIVAGIDQHISLHRCPPMHCQRFAPSTTSSKNFQCFEFALRCCWQRPESKNTDQNTSRRARCYERPNPGAIVAAQWRSIAPLVLAPKVLRLPPSGIS